MITSTHMQTQLSVWSILGYFSLSMCIDLYHHESNSDPQTSMGMLQCIGEALSDKVQVCPTALHVYIEVYVFL